MIDDMLHDTARQKLKQAIMSIERLEQEKTEITDSIKDVFDDAKALGFDTKVMRAIIKDRKKDPDEQKTFEEVYEIYKAALEPPVTN